MRTSSRRGNPPSNVLRHRNLLGLGWKLGCRRRCAYWGGWPVFWCGGDSSVINRSLNMFTLIGLGAAWPTLYSVVAKIFPNLSGLLPESLRRWGSFRSRGRHVTLVLLGQVLE